jgi:hypothetical protein
MRLQTTHEILKGSQMIYPRIKLPAACNDSDSLKVEVPLPLASQSCRMSDAAVVPESASIDASLLYTCLVVITSVRNGTLCQPEMNCLCASWLDEP